MATQEQPWIDVDDGLDDEVADLPPLEEEPPVAGPSVLAALKAQRAEIGIERHFDHDVPGWRGLLVLRFGAISPAQTTALSNRIVATKGKQVTNANLDTLIAAFRCALGRAEPGGDLEVIPAGDGEPAGLKELVEVVGLGAAPNARAAMRLLFAGANSPETALISLGNDWQEWAASASEEDDGQMGGILSGDVHVEKAAGMALLGLPAWRYLTTEDPLERLVLSAVYDRAVSTVNRINGAR